MKKHTIFNSILSILHIPSMNQYFSKGSTIKRSGLRVIYKALDPNGPKNLLKHDVTKAILKFLGLKIRRKHFSTGSTVTKMAYKDILKALRARNRESNDK